MTPGPFEIILIIVVIALLFGAKKLPELMKGMGQGIREFKKEVKDPAAPHTAQPVDVPSRQLDPLTADRVTVDPVTGAHVVTEGAVQNPNERR